MSRSFGDLRLLLGADSQRPAEWEEAVGVSPSPTEEEAKPSECSKGPSPLERLPTEIHGKDNLLCLPSSPPFRLRLTCRLL